MTYSKVREALQTGDLKGITLKEIKKLTDLEEPEIMHHIRIGYKNGGIEGFELNGTMVYRIRPVYTKKYKRRV